MKIGFAHTTGWMGRLIRWGEFLRGKVGSQWNHEFAELDDGTVIQATLRGVVRTANVDLVAPGGVYQLYDLPPEADPAKFLDFLERQVGIRYGLWTILAIAIDILTWNWFPSFRAARKPSWICSALIEEALRFAGVYHQHIDIYEVTPQDGFRALTA